MKRFVFAVVACVAVAVMFVPLAAANPDHDHSTAAPTTQSLGTVTIDGFEMEIIQDGKVEAGKEATFEIRLTGDKEPKAIRVWIGIESGRGSAKGKAHKHDEKMEVHADVPDPIPADAKLWIEVETAAGKSKGSIAFKSTSQADIDRPTPR
jgi:hypothetical protein